MTSPVLKGARWIFVAPVSEYYGVTVSCQHAYACKVRIATKSFGCWRFRSASTGSVSLANCHRCRGAGALSGMAGHDPAGWSGEVCLWLQGSRPKPNQRCIASAVPPYAFVIPRIPDLGSVNAAPGKLARCGTLGRLSLMAPGEVPHELLGSGVRRCPARSWRFQRLQPSWYRPGSDHSSSC